jgi:dTDP-4-dehydrorhamnose reductase
MRVLITGASGLLGSKLIEIAAGTGHDVISGYTKNRPKNSERLRLELQDPDEVRRKVLESKPDVIIHAAAMTDVDKCEFERDRAFNINVIGTEAIKDASKGCGAFLIYISTDYVFDGVQGRYREDDPTNPLNYYGYTKLIGEKGCDCVARAGVIYGSAPARGKVNFGLWLIEKLGSGEEVSIVTDQYTTPVLNTNLAEMIIEAAERRLSGFYHMAGSTRISRYDFACDIAREFGFDTSLIKESRMKEMNWKARRPADSSLDVTKAAQILETKPLPLKEALKILRKEIG